MSARRGHRPPAAGPGADFASPGAGHPAPGAPQRPVQLWRGRIADGICPGGAVLWASGGPVLAWSARSMCWLAIWSQPGMQWA